RDRGSKCLRIVGGRSSWVEVEWWMRASYSMPPMPSKTGAKRASADLNSVIDPRFGEIGGDASSTQRTALAAFPCRQHVGRNQFRQAGCGLGLAAHSAGAPHRTCSDSVLPLPVCGSPK